MDPMGNTSSNGGTSIYMLVFGLSTSSLPKGPEAVFRTHIARSLVYIYDMCLNIL